MIVPSAPNTIVVGGEGAVVIWEPPEVPNGVIINYKIRFTGQGNPTTILTEATILYYVPSLMDIPHTTDTTVKVEVSDNTCLKTDDICCF